MRASEFKSVRKPRSNFELQQSAVDFIKDGLAQKPEPPWKRDDASYDYAQALRAHFAELPLSKLDQTNKRNLMKKIHQKIWLENQSEVIKNQIDLLHQEYNKVRQRLMSLSALKD